MPRPLRIEYEGAIYHVMACGRVKALNRERVKRGDRLGECCTKTDWQVHALCLMGNHFHLVLALEKQIKVHR